MGLLFQIHIFVHTFCVYAYADIFPAFSLCFYFHVILIKCEQFGKIISFDMADGVKTKGQFHKMYTCVM